MRPEFIFFDLGNVLVTFDRERAFRQMSAVSGADAAVIRAIVVDHGLQQALERGSLDWTAFHAEFSRQTGTVTTAADLARAASDMFTLRVDMLPVIGGLERLGMPIGILSNTCGPHWQHLIESRYAILPGPFKPIVLSHEEGCLKPEQDIYARATERAGVPADRIFFCDDVPEHVEAARRAGWDAEVFSSAVGLVDALAWRGLDLGL
jgi:putative hydrolase of the HAD superfamily